MLLYFKTLLSSLSNKPHKKCLKVISPQGVICYTHKAPLSDPIVNDETPFYCNVYIVYLPAPNKHIYNCLPPPSNKQTNKQTHTKTHTYTHKSQSASSSGEFYQIFRWLISGTFAGFRKTRVANYPYSISYIRLTICKDAEYLAQGDVCPCLP